MQFYSWVLAFLSLDCKLPRPLVPRRLSPLPAMNSLRTLGADHTINYKTHPNWEEEVLKVTNGEGVDNVLEVGGAGTFEKSSACVKPNGTVSLIGMLTGLESPSISLMTIFNLLRIQGIFVGSTEMLTQLISTMETHKIHPQIDKKFPFSQALDAYEWMAQAKHFGKVVIESED